jgi:hypothetical protein
MKSVNENTMNTKDCNTLPLAFNGLFFGMSSPNISVAAFSARPVALGWPANSFDERSSDPQ